MGTYFKKPQSTVPKTKNLAFELVITHSLPETEEQNVFDFNSNVGHE